jgi:FlaA1/EpsC-like NDP-sugar epimerase
MVLDMGQPVRIVDLARNLIELSGLEPERDIPIVFTGLRPGEKLHEELQAIHEEALPTSNEKIMVLMGVEPLDENGWRSLSDLERALATGLPDEAMRLLGLLVPDYTPSASTAPVSQSKVVEISAKMRLDANA